VLIKYSGVISIIITWLFVVRPAFAAGVKSKYKTISHMTGEKKYLHIINGGLIFGAMMQLLFIRYLMVQYHLALLSIGVILYISTITATLLTTIFPFRKFEKIHTHVVKYYFITIPLAILFIGLQLRPSFSKLFLVSMLVPALYLIAELSVFEEYKKDNALMEMWAFYLLSVWTLIMTFY